MHMYCVWEVTDGLSEYWPGDWKEEKEDEDKKWSGAVKWKE
jgi:hypothetical protein